jgi:hypothetical protein
MTLSAKEIYHLMRRAGFPARPKNLPYASVHHTINLRAAYADAIAGKVVAGKLGIIRTGMDCDCSAYSHGYTTSYEGLILFARNEEEHCEYLDGPETTHYCKPIVALEHNGYSRDLALEAYEDGHSHIVYLP